MVRLLCIKASSTSWAESSEESTASSCPWSHRFRMRSILLIDKLLGLMHLSQLLRVHLDTSLGVNPYGRALLAVSGFVLLGWRFWRGAWVLCWDFVFRRRVALLVGRGCRISRGGEFWHDWYQRAQFFCAIRLLQQFFTYSAPNLDDTWVHKLLWSSCYPYIFDVRSAEDDKLVDLVTRSNAHFNTRAALSPEGLDFG